jgi:hypothetical protein
MVARLVKQQSILNTDVTGMLLKRAFEEIFALLQS